MQFLGVFNKFEQCVLNMALINICDSESYVGQQIRRQQDSWDESIQNIENNSGINQYTIYLPHPEQKYEDITLEQGLSKGYNVEVETVQNNNTMILRSPLQEC